MCHTKPAVTCSQHLLGVSMNQKHASLPLAGAPERIHARHTCMCTCKQAHAACKCDAAGARTSQVSSMCSAHDAPGLIPLPAALVPAPLKHHSRPPAYASLAIDPGSPKGGDEGRGDTGSNTDGASLPSDSPLDPAQIQDALEARLLQQWVYSLLTFPVK